MEEPLPKLDYLNIVRQFGINEFTITGLCMAGPDDIIGAISGPNNQYYVLWGRDYMDELEPETNTLKNELWNISPLTKIWGIGERIAAKLNYFGIYSVKDLALASLDFLKLK